MRGVFLAEECAVGTDDLEELAHYGRNAAEVPGTRAAVELAAQVANIHVGLRAGPIHLRDLGSEDEVDAKLAQQSLISLEVAGVLVQVLGPPELQGVHKDRYRGHVAL